MALPRVMVWGGRASGGWEGSLLMGWGKVVSRMPLSSDLKDMSPMVLTCDGPDKLFDSHKLVLNVPFSDSKRVGVFCARGEWTGGDSSQNLASLVYIPPFFPSLFVTLTTTYKQMLHQDTTYYPRRRFDS